MKEIVFLASTCVEIIIQIKIELCAHSTFTKYLASAKNDQFQAPFDTRCLWILLILYNNILSEPFVISRWARQKEEEEEGNLEAAAPRSRPEGQNRTSPPAALRASPSQVLRHRSGRPRY